MTLFAFAEGEGISAHSASGDAMVYIFDGEAEITVGEEKVLAKAGEVVVVPANIPMDWKQLRILKCYYR